MTRAVRTYLAAGATTALAASVLTAGAVVSAPVASANQTDPVTGCQEVYDSGVVGNTPIQFMRIINEIPQHLTVSRTTAGRVTAGRVTPAKVETKTTPVWLGQKTPYMDKGRTRDYKEYQSGSAWWTDHWWDAGFTRHTVGCQTNIPFVVGPGNGSKAYENTYNYKGEVFGRDGQQGEGNWWAFPKNYSREGVQGFHSWTCRGEVTNPGSVYWAKVDGGSGFYGDTDKDRNERDAGRAPACRDDRLKNLTVRSYLEQSYYGNLTSNVRKGNRCEVSGTTAIGCWNEIYPGPWVRSWRQITHVYGVAVRATLQSSAEIEIPIEYREAGDPAKRRLSWVITRAENYGGTWPTGSQGLADNRVPTGDGVSPFTVVGGIPGSTEPYQIGTWGNVKNAEQKLTFRLTATTDGTWSWPVSSETGEPLLRPSVDLVFRYTLNDFNYQGASCSATSDGTGPWSANQPCLFGKTPTIFQVSDNIQQNERRDPKLNDKGQPISTADWRFEAVQGGWNTSDLKVQQVGEFDWGGGDAGGRYVGANAKWNVNLSGLITNLQ